MKNSIVDTSADIIKAHILDPENSLLPSDLQSTLSRAVSLTKLLDKHPVPKNAIKYHRAMYPDICDRTAYNDLSLARKLFNNYQTFDFDFWLSWTINDITSNIEKCKSTGLSSDRKIIAMEHANLGKILGKRPDEPADPLRNEKHAFYIMINVGTQCHKIDLNKLNNLPESSLYALTKTLLSENEIDEQGAAQIMNS